MNPIAQPIDILIHPGWIVPVVPEGEVLTAYSLAIAGERIVGILPREEAELLEAGEVLELPDHILMPGLINAHGHAAMTLLRGYADDQALTPWLEQHIWPAEAAHVSDSFVRDGSELAIAEMIRGGTTTFSDMYFFPEVCARVASDSGMRCQITFPVFDHANAWARDADECISKGLILLDDFKHSSLVTVVFGPHAPYTVSDTNLSKVATLAAELDVAIHIHLHETQAEVEQAVAESGERPLHKLHRLGLLGPKTQCVHMTALDDSDISLLAASGAHVIHCPQSNMKLASGSCPVDQLQNQGINVALGTDGAASNNDLNMFGEMQSAALLAKLMSGDPTAVRAEQALTMATLAGARALGIDDKVGSLEVGKLADLIAVDMSQPETTPLYHPLSQLVYACNGSQVSHSWINGKPVMQDRKLCHINQAALNNRIAQWQHTISGTAQDTAL